MQQALKSSVLNSSVAKIVIVICEHPTELSSKFIGRKVGIALKKRGHKVTIAKMPVSESLFRKMYRPRRERLAVSHMLYGEDEVARFRFLSHVYSKFPDAIILSFHNSPLNEQLDFERIKLKRTKPTKQAVNLSEHKPITFTPFADAPRLIVVKIPAIFKAMPPRWIKSIERICKKTGIMPSRQLKSIVDLKKTEAAGLMGPAMTKRVLGLVSRRVSHFETGQMRLIRRRLGEKRPRAGKLPRRRKK